jgi:hypothetical protein
VRHLLVGGLCLAALGAGGTALAATAGSFRGAKARSAAARQVTLSSPGNGASTQSLPAFSWSATKGASTYQFQLSADSRFGSIVKGGSITTANTYATIATLPADGEYFWRVRGIDSKGNAGKWSSTRSLTKSWSTRPALLQPPSGSAISYPATPLVLTWSAVPEAVHYSLQIATDPSFASSVKSVTTGGTSYAVTSTLPAGTYYWSVTPLDAEDHKGSRSATGSFDWSWPTGTTLNVFDSTGTQPLDSTGLVEVLSPELSWNPVPGAARYEVEVNPSADFAPGSKVCCSASTTATSLSQRDFLPNNVYHWRVRALDLDDNAGVWNVGPDFRKQFDDVLPPISDLQLRDAEDHLLSPGAGTASASPIVSWNAVIGAASYQVMVAGYNGSFCDWGHPKTFTTSNTAWTPLHNDLTSGGVYCVRVRAVSDSDLNSNAVTSDFTQLGGDSAGFEYDPVSVGPTTPSDAQDSDYLTARSGSSTATHPVFRWHAIAGASSYWVWVVRDSLFTKTVEKQLTNVPAYAPRATYSDENTHYYWVVEPANTAAGDGCPCDWHTDNPQFFDKSSNPPGLMAPATGASVSTQPTFRWSSAVGAKTYRLQVAQDPTFSTLIDDVTTDATSFTSSTTYPADTVLYWRVRANAENDIGLNWSLTGTFRRVLPAPTLDPGNPTGGDSLPLITWSLVQGATSYDMHVDQADGTTKDFTFRSAAMTPTTFFGTGVWSWKVRANFPKAGAGETHGPYSAAQSYTRHIDPPAGTRYINLPHRLLLSWNPDPAAEKYKVQISANDSFGSTIASATTETTDYAPLLTQSGFKNGGLLYWRVALVDSGGNTGAWTTRTLTLPKRMTLRVTGSLRRRVRGMVTVAVTDAKGRAVKKVKIHVQGAGLHVSRRTGRRGTVRIRLRPSRVGMVKFSGSKSGFQLGGASLRVR